MNPPRSMRTRYWRPRFTIGSLMLTILAIALFLAVLRPIAGLLHGISPGVAATLRELSTPETGLVLGCLVIGGFVTARLMGMDEKG